jgi:Uma2 family endonuclease
LGVEAGRVRVKGVTMVATTKPTSPQVAPVFRLTVERYHQMIDRGILTEDDDVELIEGVLLTKFRKSAAHEAVLERLYPVLCPAVPDDVMPRCQLAVTFAESEPEPDISICEPARHRGGRKPTAADTFVVMEVADASLAYDRGDKLRVYARAGIPVYWVVNVVDRQVEVYADPVTPTGGLPQYRTRRIYLPGESVPIVVRGQQVATVPVSDFLA